MKIVFLTMHPDIGYATEALALGDCAYVVKKTPSAQHSRRESQTRPSVSCLAPPGLSKTLLQHFHEIDNLRRPSPFRLFFGFDNVFVTGTFRLYQLQHRLGVFVAHLFRVEGFLHRLSYRALEFAHGGAGDLVFFGNPIS